MDSLLVSLILTICSNAPADKVYTVQTEQVSCMDYYVNCAVDNKGNITEQSINRCLNESK